MTGAPIVVVGNGVAGFACARRLAEHGAAVLLVGPGLPYDRPPLSKRALARGRVVPLDDRAGLAARGIRHVDGRVIRLDLPRGDVVVELAGGPERELRADRVVWAAGLVPTAPSIPGADALETCMTAAGVRRLARRLAGGQRRVAVVGAGLVGCEAAATLAARHRVTLLADGPPLQRLPAAARHAVALALVEAGVEVRRDGRVDAIEPTPRGLVVHGGGPRWTVDVGLAATGSRAEPCPGLDLGPDGVVADETLAVPGRPGLWVCGDLAVHPHPRHGLLVVPHWDHAVASGRHVADGLLGRHAPFVREPYWFSDIGRLRLQSVGHAAAAVEWRERGGMHVGLDPDARPVCALVIDAPSLLPAARALLAA